MRELKVVIDPNGREIDLHYVEDDQVVDITHLFHPEDAKTDLYSLGYEWAVHGQRPASIV